MNKTRRRGQEEEIPKSVLKMKQEKAKREEAERNSKTKKQGKKNKKEKKKKGKKSWKKRLILFVLLVALVIIAIFLGISAFTWKQLAEDMFTNTNSVVVDTEGDIIATLGEERKKLTVPIEEMPENLTNAYVAIEDERFYTHLGVDVRRTGAAILNYITHFGNSSFGGSTITQQLVKNMTMDSSDSVTRKVKEWWKAFLLECYYTKEEILEMYLNVIYVGPNVYGVQGGAKYYFDKEVSDLSLAECAFLAGINNSPNSYNPFGDEVDNELITERTLTVLQKMQELGYIEESELTEAKAEVEDGLDFDQGTIETGDPIYSYHTDALISEVLQDLQEKYNISEDFAQNYLYLAGLTIHSTQDSDMQDEVETEFQKRQYQLKSADGESTAQAAMVILDHSNGNVLACAGGLGEKTTYRGLNRATQSTRQTGSSIKPLAVLIPGIDRKQFTASSIYEDKQTTFAEGYAPKNSDDSYLGEITVRRALESSQNIPFVEMMEEVTPSRAISYLENMGITSLTEEDNSLTLALGGLENGISPLEMAGAYATIANDGEYTEPVFYVNAVNDEGSIVLRPEQETREVFSPQVAYVIKELLTQPVEGSHGTATYCSIPGIEVAAKTGTTDENYDKWLCGFTPYYTAVTWFGYDNNESIYYYNQNPAGIIWANVMRRVHDGLQNMSFIKPGSLETVTICADTGMLARTGCTNTYEEYYLRGTAPELCSKHSGSRVTESSSTESTNQPTGVYRDDEEELELDPEEENVIQTNRPEENTIVENEVTEEPINDVIDEEENEPENSNNNNTTNTIESEEPENPKENNTIPENTVDNTVGGDNTNTISDGEESDVEDGSNEIGR